MHRMTPRAAAFRAHTGGGARGLVEKIASSHLMQEMAGGIMQSERREKVEHAEPYGFTSAILPKDENSGEGAEHFTSFLGANRTHPVAMVIADRRHRPRGFKPGENAQYDDVGQMTLLRRGFARMLSLDTAAQAGQQAVERFVSMAHVNKQKQQRPQAGGDAAKQKEQTQQQEDFKHEGESVNLEWRISKNKAQLFDGTTEVLLYDKQAGVFRFKKKVIFEKDVDFGEGATHYMRVGLNNDDHYADADPKVRGKPGTTDPD